ncbi:gluconate 2-dehydrogenase subunit 3 family protein [Salinicoccus roseus]|uniref:gluconate 2-dehydrogenase subunit 3 family protein n=1 Tax=Salinicoccus roseus TaxID=45670 RepID=UPI0023009E01|nr:gluconate 2-dehydrogenase subunit 3 family protein [Salinicoccus roseus]
MADIGEEKQFSRRDFLKTTGVFTGGILGGSLLGGVFMNQSQMLTEEEPEVSDDATSEDEAQTENMAARTFFSRSEDFATLAAATERIYPEDDNGPGAIQLGVPYFIDRQMYGFWGQNSQDYSYGPFDPTSDTHGFQAKLNRGEVFLAGLRRLQELSMEEHDQAFADLDGGAQDELLRSFESGDVEIRGVRPETFFSLLRNATIEGVYSDPAYGGNKDMQGWKMIEYPGPRMGWAEDIESEEFMSLDPEGLRSYQGGGI